MSHTQLQAADKQRVGPHIRHTGVSLKGTQRCFQRKVQASRVQSAQYVPSHPLSPKLLILHRLHSPGSSGLTAGRLGLQLPS